MFLKFFQVSICDTLGADPWRFAKGKDACNTSDFKFITLTAGEMSEQLIPVTVGERKQKQDGEEENKSKVFNFPQKRT